MNIYDFVGQLIEMGYTPIPGYDYRNPQPYGNGEIYPPDCKVQSKFGKIYNPWDTASMVGIRLDRLLLVDYDGNKDEKPELSVRQLARQIGVDDMRPALCQWGKTENGGYNGSFHFLFQLPKIINSDNFYHSQDGAIKGVDFKTGNQLMWIKKHKIQNLKNVADIPKATKEMIDILRKPPEERTNNNVAATIKRAGDSQHRGLMWLSASADQLAGMGEGTGRNVQFNKTALSACRHALANEFSLQLAESMLKSAAEQCGLSKSEIRDTWRSASRKAQREGPKNLIERRNNFNDRKNGF